MSSIISTIDPNYTITSTSNSTGDLTWGSYGGGIGGSTVPFYFNKTENEAMINPLSNLSYNIEFEVDENNLLSRNLSKIRKNKFIFRCNYVNNRIQPYEFIMKLIEDKKKFFVEIEVSDILTIRYTNFRFIEIQNNINFNNDCDFSELKVKFKYDKILYQNHQLSTKQLRTDKLKKIMKTENQI